jgi:hypothetical protein
MAKKISPSCALIDFCNLDLAKPARVRKFETTYDLKITAYQAPEVQELQADLRKLLHSIVMGKPDLIAIHDYVGNLATHLI